MEQLKFGHFLKGKGRAYAEGFVSGLAEKLRNAEAHLQNTSESKALILRSNELAEFKRNLAETFLKVKKNIKLGSPKTRQNKNYSEAYSQGQEDGRSTDLNRLHTSSKKNRRIERN